MSPYVPGRLIVHRRRAARYDGRHIAVASLTPKVSIGSDAVTLPRSFAWLLLLVCLAGCARDSTAPRPAVTPGPAARATAAPPPALSGREYPLPASVADAAPEEFAAPGASHGRQLYATYCATCHGQSGRGDGRAAGFTRIPPTDFTQATFKVRSTRRGSLPTARDLENTIRRGAGGRGAMPSFAFLDPADIRALVQVVQSFSTRWERERPVSIALPPMAGDPIRGGAIYRRAGCVLCHGESGAGDGRLARELQDSRGLPDVPTDLTQPWTFKGGSDEAGLVQSIATGFNGTNMPAFQPKKAGGSELWDLAAYLRSLQNQEPPILQTTRDSATLAGFWRHPIAAQAGDLAAVSCASCHPLQFADWSRSRHAMAMSPGVHAKMQARNPEMCASCHAPLENQSTDAYLMADGVSCAACHVRQGAVFGPSPTAQSVLPLAARHRPPHGPLNARPFFEQSEFCSGCHHFAEGSAPSVHGTTLQNTFEEWRQSRAAREGRSCQSCHMPGRRHFFKGIHDPQTVRDAVRWSFEVDRRGAARMTLTNTGAGHALPTYVVPEIWMQIEVKDRNGVTLDSAAHLIARKVKFENNAWTQLSDTRLPPDQTATLEYSRALPAGAVSITGRVVVLPDLWQAESFATEMTAASSDTARRYLQAALAETTNSGYTLFQEERRLDR